MKNTNSYTENIQQNIQFFKTKFGLYKNHQYVDKRIKDDVYRVINYIKYAETSAWKTDFKKRPKTLFAKRFNKLFFRAGRNVLASKFEFKKTIIQKYLSKKIHHFIKKPDIRQLKSNDAASFVIKAGVLYTLNDARLFIKIFGIQVNAVNVYNPESKIIPNDLIKILWVKLLFKFLKKKKQNIISNLKKIKTYKFRMKQFVTRKKIEWVPINS
jgi:hypothetical protein